MIKATFFHEYSLSDTYFAKFLNIYIKLHDKIEIIEIDNMIYAKVKNKEIYNWSYDTKSMILNTDLGKVSIAAMIN